MDGRVQIKREKRIDQDLKTGFTAWDGDIFIARVFLVDVSMWYVVDDVHWEIVYTTPAGHDRSLFVKTRRKCREFLEKIRVKGPQVRPVVTSRKRRTDTTYSIWIAGDWLRDKLGRRRAWSTSSGAREVINPGMG
jgi:hypothetical protein